LELAIPDVEIVSLDYRQMKEEPYLNINPHGTVPAYQEDGGLVLLESAAIVTYLCEKYDAYHHMLPEDLRGRARYYQFAHYAPATLYTKAGGLYVHAWEFRPGTAGADKQSAEAIEDSRKWLSKHFVPFLTRELSGSQYLLGDNFSAADAIMGWEVMLLGKVGFLQDHPKLQAYHDRLAARPSFLATYPPEIHTTCIWPHDQPECRRLHHSLAPGAAELQRRRRRRTPLHTEAEL